MSYQALYRTYRPKTFDQMVGQEHVVRALKNQIKKGTLSHAYIFNGTRGVGKTTAARIFARAVNCLHNQSGNPCLKCAMCADRAQNVDIIEIDSASYNGVDAARELREKATYAPSHSQYKVYIIDEAHMLTGPAFDALLKILEEPPSYTIFILCTTEIQKFPATIMSRCMRFDFRLASTEEIVGLLKPIFDQLKVKYTDDALNAIATAGEGSYRDSLTVADRCIAYCEGELTYAAVTEVLGITGKDTLIALADAIIGQNSALTLNLIDKLVREGKSVHVLNRDLCRHFRDLLVIADCDNANTILRYPKTYFEKMTESVKGATAEKLLFAVESFVRLETTLRTSLNPQVLLEASALRLCASSGEVDCDGLDMRLTRIEKQLNSVAVQQTSTRTRDNEQEQSTTEVTPVQPPKKQDADKGQTDVRATKTSVLINAKQAWAEVIDHVRLRRMMLLKTVCTDVASVKVEGSDLIVMCSKTQYATLTDKDNNTLINGVLKGRGLKLKAVLTEEAPKKSDLEGIFISDNTIIR